MFNKNNKGENKMNLKGILLLTKLGIIFIISSNVNADVLSFVSNKNVEYDSPLIESISPEQILHGENTAILNANNVTSSYTINKVEASIYPPNNPQKIYISPVSELQTIEFHNISGTSNYSAIYDNFTTYGEYQIVIIALDCIGNKSAPLTTTVVQTIGPDVFEEDDTIEQSKVIIINSKYAQRHTFHDAGDEDWIKFYGIPGKPYKLRVINLDVNAKPVMEFYGPNKQRKFGVDIYDELKGQIELSASDIDEEGMHYIKLTNKSEEVFGKNTGFDFRLSYTGGPLPGTVFGVVTDNYGNPLEGVIVQTDQNVSAPSFSNGYYMFGHNDGKYIISASKPCYIETSDEIDISQLSTTNHDITLTKLDIGLKDIIKGLKFIAGNNLGDTALQDTVSNSIIGMEDNIFILQCMKQYK